MIQAIAFYIFATVVIVSAGLTIASRNPVHSVMWLILAFFNAAGLMVLCGAEFIAMLLVIVYVGAVAVLFLFVVMMLDIEVAAMRAGFARYLPLGLALAVALLAEVIIAFQAWSVGGVQLAARAAPIAPEVSNIQAIGNLLYTRYLFIFEGAGLVLLVAMIGAIVLTHRKRGGVRPQNIAKQNARQPHEAIRNINQPIGQGVEL
ncbi:MULTISPECIES: NADH-quinone oxidoreductase subunit J [Sphingomonas]|uniref:NADH-quinone oxidoreductase subunit J n=8 Tax=Sphingomonas TaxID=13687 RepID=A0A0A1W3C4_9SPHN|nr:MULTISPECIES: NADH-quinone oxidoreductase subunit J [Sphingomonas]MBB3879183.1 NADH-quinone oxidoreductase subunit J [Sphingomonas pseudosanguinis]HIV78985.1 NADH-quinone oxidoreductase subunit J [Candidatus Sphingomonas excrementigallinarum]APX66579.1 NADH:ubiquinone oxidoreductase subunit J [Sphingomonas sp. LK11]EGI56336.1 NADH-ubiquinone/plastoquinone oxidoreductase chain 6 family protein [Sphingomonas sp. S17]KQO50730.1 NADH:ubiquinone oxidoreductase subunit J [Sphingomonas sp. Leaf257